MAVLLRRALASLVVVFGVTVITFVLMHGTAGSFIPGLSLNPNLTPKDVALLRSQLGLDQPLWIQYFDWIGLSWLMAKCGLGGLLGGHGAEPPRGMLEGSFGHSMIDGTSVTGQILERLPNSMLLAAAAVFVGVALALPIGIAGARRRGSRTDHVLTVASVAGVAIPQFWLGLLLVWFFSLRLRAWGLPSLPSSGAASAISGGGVGDRVAHLVMPTVVLSFTYLAIWSRYLRSNMIEVLGQDYIRTARAKGMTRRRVVYVHALRNAAVPLVTLIGLELSAFFSGALIVEVVFNWPGIGLLLYQRAVQYDYTSVLGIVTVGAVVVIVGNLIADLAYAALDPRVRATHGQT
jgi:peptide/nickel transport system permease protein